MFDDARRDIEVGAEDRAGAVDDYQRAAVRPGGEVACRGGIDVIGQRLFGELV